MSMRDRKMNNRARDGQTKPAVSTDQIKMATEILARADQEITIREGGQSRKTTLRAAVIAAQVKSALGGSVYAQAQILKLFEKYDELRSLEISEHNAYWQAYCKVKSAEIAEAKMNGLPEPEILPHPDDIVFEPGKPAAFCGPFTELELARCKSNQEWSLQMLRLDALEMKERKKGQEDTKQTTAHIAFFVFQQSLPQRLRMSEIQYICHCERFHTMNKRLLLKEISQGWRKLGLSVRRGANLPPFEVGVEFIRRLYGFVNLAVKAEIDTGALSRRHVSENDAEKLTKLGIQIN